MQTYTGLTKFTPNDHHINNKLLSFARGGEDTAHKYFVHKRVVENMRHDTAFSKPFVTGGYQSRSSPNILLGVGGISILKSNSNNHFTSAPVMANVSNLVDRRLAPPVNPIGVR